MLARLKQTDRQMLRWTDRLTDGLNLGITGCCFLSDTYSRVSLLLT
jgi:hypothetical protein